MKSVKLFEYSFLVNLMWTLHVLTSLQIKRHPSHPKILRPAKKKPKKNRVKSQRKQRVSSHYLDVIRLAA